MGYSADQYREQLKALLPPGRAFPRERGNTLDSLTDAMAQELARIDVRADRLTFEAVPSSTSEMLADWERVAGLPDSCSGLLSDTQQGRRNDLVSKLVSRGGQSIAYFKSIALALGFEIEIDEFRPFRAGHAVAGDPLTNGQWVFVWRVRAPEVTVTSFRAGSGAAGEPLATWGNAGLECRILRYKPAHTRVIFAYGVGGVLLLDEGDVFLVATDTALILE